MSTDEAQEAEKTEEEQVEQAEEQKAASELEAELLEQAKLLLAPEESGLRSIMLYGDIDEDKISEIIAGMLVLCGEKSSDDIKMYLSTLGGNADEMFSLYDMMNHVKKTCDIETIGLGKVMSAGVLLLAAGTKGKRRIGQNCRVMIHSCNAGNIGDIHDLKNEMEQISDLQDKFINALVQETTITKRQLTKLLDRKLNIYLTAEEAIEYGIADEIF